MEYISEHLSFSPRNAGVAFRVVGLSDTLTCVCVSEQAFGKNLRHDFFKESVRMDSYILQNSEFSLTLQT